MENLGPGLERLAISLRRDADDLLFETRRPALLQRCNTREIVLLQIHHPLKAERQRIAHAQAFLVNVEKTPFQP